ncbi:MAG: CRISPR-associated protein Cas4 [Oscillospiraceae bacterium]
MISGLQHFIFCRRQWALVHIEQQWQENSDTIKGDLFHKQTHDETKIKKRGDLLIASGMRIVSHYLGITGQCDTVEFHKSQKGISLFGYDGKWDVYPIEYKKGKPKEHDADKLQLCAQAMCLEEMLACKIDEGSLFYGETRHRLKIEISDELRCLVKDTIKEMRKMIDRGYTPKPKKQKGCNSCSIKDLCVPGLEKTELVKSYITSHITEEIL